MLLYLFLTLFAFAFCKKTVEENKYTDLRSTFTYVDKTPLIYELLRHKYVFLSVPSKFGKTSNLDMINLFLGRQHSKTDIEHYFVFTKIWESPEIVEEHMGKHPVVHFSLKLNEFSKDFDHVLTAFQVAVYNAYSDHVYLLESKRVSDEQIKLLKIYTDYTKCRHMGVDMTLRGLGVLCEVLHKFHSKPVVLLADDFGIGITDGILENQADLQKIVDFYSSFLDQTFHNQSLVSHALFCAENWLHGVTGPGVQILDHVPFMEKVEWSRFFGFTHDEAERLLDKNVKDVTEKQKKEIFKWYCGYTSPDSFFKFKICNPYSIVEYIARKKETAHWTGSTLGFDLLRKLVRDETLQVDIYHLYWRRTVDIKVREVNETLDLQLLTKEVAETPEACGNFFFGVLHECGFVTAAEDQEHPGNLTLKFPNEEIRDIARKLITNS